MNKQITNSVLMIRPVQFRMNEQTAVNNYYQKKIKDLKPVEVNRLAVQEFDALVDKLRSVGIHVIVVNDTKEFDTPDSIFPNNWISFHHNGTAALYPMFAENRRHERKESVLEAVEQNGFFIEHIIDYSTAEQEEIFLEGTGSIILDRENRKAYCALSPRADEALFIEFCEDFDFFPVVFSAYHPVGLKRKKIYHTNVMMCIGTTFAVVCLNSIDEKKERKNLVNHLRQSNKDIIDLTENQINQFAGNMLQLSGADQKSYLVMSQSSFDSLRADQRTQLEKHTTLISSPLDTIEVCGGGSARCMMAEIFLPKVTN
ncbi:MAG: arginine deiminase-related protein [Bacteroidetes bacterium]|nr:arginine deiminase-related protein [Bacteroidota bacterium]MDA1176885.1 arginine deiminase-related protein [Bacteroidota bacterium]